MPSEHDQAGEFLQTIKEILEIPGVSKKQIADWADVDASSVTRWHQGVTPNNPVEILRRLRPHVEKARKDAAAATASVRRTEVGSWRSLVGDMDAEHREQVARTGLLATTYYVFMVWDPEVVSNHERDIVIMRYFSGVWAKVSRRLYNIGDVTQTASIAEHKDDAAPFSQERPIGKHVRFKLRWERELAQAVARLHIQLDLTELKSKGDAIAVIDDFGYRYRARRAIVDARVDPKQTNEFLGAPIVFPCRRFRLVVCVPKSSVLGSPSALSYNNRAMLRLLLQLDRTEPDEIESLLWPLGKRFELSSAPDAQLKALPYVDTLIDDLPHGLQEALSQPVNLDEPHKTLLETLCDSQRSACFLLDLHHPHPSLIHTIVWRLNDIDTSEDTEPKPEG